MGYLRGATQVTTTTTRLPVPRPPDRRTRERNRQQSHLLPPLNRDAAHVGLTRTDLPAGVSVLGAILLTPARVLLIAPFIPERLSRRVVGCGDGVGPDPVVGTNHVV